MTYTICCWLECWRRAVIGAVVELSGCIDAPARSTSNAAGTAVWKDVIQFCWGSANDQCIFKLVSLPSGASQSLTDFTIVVSVNPLCGCQHQTLQSLTCSSLRLVNALWL